MYQGQENTISRDYPQAKISRPLANEPSPAIPGLALLHTLRSRINAIHRALDSLAERTSYIRQPVPLKEPVSNATKGNEPGLIVELEELNSLAESAILRVNQLIDELVI